MGRSRLKQQAPATPPTPLKKVFHSVEEAAEILNLGRSTVFTLIRERRLHTARVGKRRLVSASELEAFAVRLQEEEGA